MATLEIRNTDDYFFNLAISEDQISDRRSQRFRRWFARKKIETLGFSDTCNLYITPKKIKTPAIYLLSNTTTEDKTNKGAILSLIEGLSNLGCSVNVYNEEAGLLPINNAIVWGDIELFRLLIKLGADINMPTKRTNKLTAIAFTKILIKIKTGRKEPVNKQKQILNILETHNVQ